MAYRGLCSVPHCSRQRRAYGPYCQTHTNALRRHGHPEQKTIRKSTLAPYKRKIDAWLNNRPDAVEHLEGVLRGILGDARAYLSLKVSNKWQRTAYQQLLLVTGDAGPRDVIVNALAMAYLWKDQPRLFKGDDVLPVQTARRVIALSPQNFKQYAVGARGDKGSRAVREVNQRVLRLLGQMMVEKIGVYGVQLADVHERARQAEQERRRALLDIIATEETRDATAAA